MSKELRQRMVADMQLAGLSSGTQATYLQCVDTFMRHTWLAPEQATEQDLAEYLRHLQQNGAARGTFKPARYGLQFVFQNTLGRKWPLFEKKSARPDKSGSRKP